MSDRERMSEADAKTQAHQRVRHVMPGEGCATMFEYTVGETLDEAMRRELDRAHEPLTPDDVREHLIGLGDFDGGDDA